jgi:hypothetical protein
MHAHLLRSIWNKNTITSRQETIKYLEKISTVTTNDMPLEHRNDSRILAFIFLGRSNFNY